MFLDRTITTKEGDNKNNNTSDYEDNGRCHYSSFDKMAKLADISENESSRYDDPNTRNLKEIFLSIVMSIVLYIIK